MSFGERLKATRTAAGLSQPQLSLKSGVPVGTIRDYEQVRRDPLLQTALKLADALGVTIDELARDGQAQTPARKKRGK